MAPTSRTIRGRGKRARAFSLAEMMIALIILGFGLLVVGAALPVGLKYTQETVNRSTGEAAAGYALDLIEQRIRLCQDPYDETTTLLYRTDLFRPRNATTGELLMDTSDGMHPRLWEPLVKVRPLLTVGINPDNPALDLDPLAATSAYRQVEQDIAEWVGTVLGVEQPYVEHDNYSATLWTAPALPSLCAVYPPVKVTDVNGPLAVQGFFDAPYAPLEPLGVELASARRQAAERVFTWTAFYRRVSYADGSDPNLYEIIVVVTRRANETRGYPEPLSAMAGSAAGSASSTPGGPSTPGERGGVSLLVAPVPVLVTFDDSVEPPWEPQLIPGTDYALTAGRELSPVFSDPGTLTFRASADVGPLLPPGSIFIPAVNDDQPSALNPLPPLPPNPPARKAGFVPHAPDTLPIYKVLDRKLLGDGRYELTVENNGFYPWTSPAETAGLWPVWVIPPAVKGTDFQGLPIYDDTSPIVTIKRRIVRFREVP